MNSIKTGWRKHASGTVQFFSNTQNFQEKSIDNPRKKVRFNCETPKANKQAFENPEENDIQINQLNNVSFEDLNSTTLSAKNIFTNEFSENYNKPICSVRGTIITFIIIVLIIIVTAVTLGIVFGTIGFSQKTVTTTNQSPFTSVTSMASTVFIGNQSGTPCSSYTTINDPTRNVAYMGGALCDDGPIFNSSDYHVWIRFVGSGGTIIPLSSPDTNHCGSYSTAWFNGTLPTVINTIINATICVTTDSFECAFTIITSVIYCPGGFYIYSLLPFQLCSVRYCTT